MAYALIFAGIVLTVAGVRNTQGALYSYLAGEFQGPQSYGWWALSIVAIGSVGYIEDARKLANYFLALILIVLLIAQNKQGRDVFTTFVSTLKQPLPPAPVAQRQSVAQSSATAYNQASPNVGGLNLGPVGKMLNQDLWQSFGLDKIDPTSIFGSF